MGDITVDWVTFETEHEGDKVSMKLLPMSTPDMLDLLDLATGEPKDILKIIEPMFKKYVKDIQGKTVNGKSPTADQFATVGRLYSLATAILTELGMISQLSENERKNLSGLSGSQTSGKKGPKK